MTQVLLSASFASAAFKSQFAGLAVELAADCCDLEARLSLFYRSFGALNARYYFRHLFFGALIASLLIAITVPLEIHQRVIIIAIATINTLLYPYSRFVYESVVGFILGRNQFFVNSIWFLATKVLTMVICWGLAVFIAPIGLLYLVYATRPSVANQTEEV